MALEGAALIAVARGKDAIPVLELALSLQAKHPAAPGVVANLQYQLARALVASHGDRARAAELARSARDELAKVAFKKPLLDELDAWRASEKL